MSKDFDQRLAEARGALDELRYSHEIKSSSRLSESKYLRIRDFLTDPDLCSREELIEEVCGVLQEMMNEYMEEMADDDLPDRVKRQAAAYLVAINVADERIRSLAQKETGEAEDDFGPVNLNDVEPDRLKPEDKMTPKEKALKALDILDSAPGNHDMGGVKASVILRDYINSPTYEDGIERAVEIVEKLQGKYTDVGTGPNSTRSRVLNKAITRLRSELEPKLTWGDVPVWSSFDAVSVAHGEGEFFKGFPDECVRRDSGFLSRKDFERQGWTILSIEGRDSGAEVGR